MTMMMRMKMIMMMMMMMMTTWINLFKAQKEGFVFIDEGRFTKHHDDLVVYM